MLQANLPRSMWIKALNIIAYLRNRSATKDLDGIMPIETLSKKKPYIGYLRTIGNKAMVLNFSLQI